MAIREKCQDKLNRVIDQLVANHAQVCFVGGCVRDELLGKNMKDFDIEVFQFSQEQLETCLSSFGKCDLLGKSFGVYKLFDLPEADFALPRTEIKTKAGHQGFDVSVNPDLSIETAARRRDFTINAIYYDVNHDIYIDPFGGIEDLKQKVIRVVDASTFPEDPLRVLRLAQFLSRLDFEVDPASKELCQKMVARGDLESLSKERVMAEYDKLLLGQRPSKGLQFLMDIDALPTSLANLQTTKQRPDYHPEGSAWTHTLAVVDRASKLKEKSSWPLAFMWSALLHDIGKTLTTDEFGHAYEHEIVGASLAVELLSGMQKNKSLERYVQAMVENHMKLMTYAFHYAKDKTFLKLLWQIDGKTTLNDLYYLTQCDSLSRGLQTDDAITKLNLFLKDKVSRLGDKAPKPLVNGKDLLACGFAPGPMMKTYLHKAYDLQLGGMPKHAILKVLKRGKNHGT